MMRAFDWDDEPDTDGAPVWIVLISALIALISTIIREVMRTRRHKAAIKQQKAKIKRKMLKQMQGKVLERIEEMDALLQHYAEVIERIGVLPEEKPAPAQPRKRKPSGA